MIVLLAHGIAGFGEIALFNLEPLSYFNGLKKALEADGVNVHVAAVEPLGNVPLRATQLGEHIKRAAKLERGAKVHIIAHSMGGLDARVALSPDGLNLGKLVASLTMISTPHQGVSLASLFDPLAKPLRRLHAFDRITGIRDLTPAAATMFNAAVRDHAGVSYRPITCVGRSARRKTCLAMLPTHLAQPKPNDGMVPRAAATWNDHTFVDEWRCDHADAIGWDLDRMAAPKHFDHLQKYREQVALLRAM